jgi:predicted DNA binding CopG/RHH family protein
MRKKKENFIDDPEDLAMIAAYKRGEFKPVPNQKEAIAALRRAAVNFKKKKEARINVRVQMDDLNGLRLRAEEEGIPYQTLVASLIHKYVGGRLVNKGA